MPEPDRVLAYASAHQVGAADDDDGCGLQIRFAAPPAWPAQVSHGVTVCVCAGFSLLLLFLTFASTWSPDRNAGSAVVFFIGATVLGTYGYRAWNALRRLTRFAGRPVTLRVVAGRLVVNNPPQWGAAERTYPAEEVIGCRGEYGFWTFRSDRVYRISFSLCPCGQVRVDVAVTDRSTGEQAVEQLSRALGLDVPAGPGAEPAR